MNSSTFSSKHEWKVILVVALTLLACEVGARFSLRWSADAKHRSEIPRLASQLREKPSPRALFLGNSLTRRGIDVDSFEDQLGRHGLRLGGVCKVCPDGTALQQWHYILERYFSTAAAAQSPDLVIVTFADDQLADQAKPRLRRTALNVEGKRQILQVLRNDARSLEDAVCFLAAHFSASLAYQPDFKDAIMRRVVPHYRSETRRLAKVHLAYLERKASQTRPLAETKFTYHRLGQFLEFLKQNDCSGVFCLIPLPGKQTVDDEMIRTIESNNMTFLDFRALASRTRGHYPDGYHMDPVAAEIYSRALADAIVERLPGLFAAPVPPHLPAP